MNRSPRIALVCDWLTTPGGAEKVLLELHRMYPDAPIYTSQYRQKGITWFSDAEVRTGWLNLFPASLRKLLGPLRQLYFSHLDLTRYDLVISVTGAEAKSVQATKHLCYCHVPTQYYWQMYDSYLENPGFGFLNPLVRFFLKLFIKPLRKADFAAAKQPAKFVTISSYAAAEIKKYYGRDSTIIAPPVDTKAFSTALSNFSTASPQKSATFPQLFHRLSTENSKFSTGNPSYFIISCRQVTWKRVDLAIKACLEAKLPLLVVGDGPEHENLVKLAASSPYIEFLPWTETRELASLLRGASGYIFPSLEPFGIAAVEALAAGCPVIAYAQGGSRDIVEAGKNGLLFAEQTPASLVSALKKFRKYRFDPVVVQKSATKFDAKIFRQQIRHLVSIETTNPSKTHEKHL